MDVVIVGRCSFNADALKDKSLKEVKEAFAYIPEKIVAEAWKKANPKGYTKKKRVVK